MAIQVTHTTVAVGTDAGNGEIRKAQWNEAHTINMATSKLLGRSSAGTGAAEEISIGSGLSLSAGTLSASGGVANGIVWSTPITYNITSTDPTSINYWYPGFVTGGGPVYVYISMVPTSGPSNADYHKILMRSPASNVTPDLLVNNFSGGYKVYETSLLFGNSQNLGKTALRLQFLSRPSFNMTISVSFGFPSDNGATLTSVNTWSSSTTIPSQYQAASIFTDTYSRITSAAGSQINATYATTAGSASTATSATSAGSANYATSAGSANYATSAGSASTASSASSAGTATFSNYAMGLRHEYGNWNALISGSSPTNGQVLAYNSSSGRFEPATAGGGGGVTSIVAGTGISITSTGPGGTGAVTINASGGGGGANPPPAGAAGVTLRSGLDGSSGYIPYPPEFTPTGTWNSASLRAFVVTADTFQPFPAPYPFSYWGISLQFNTSYGTMYMHRYDAFNFDFSYLDPNGFYYYNLPFVSASALVFMSTYSQTPSGFAGYNIFGGGEVQDYGPGIEFPTLPPPPGGTNTTYDSKELVFFQSGDTLTPATGVTELATVSGPFRVSLFSVPSTFVKASGPPPSPNLTYGGSWSVGVVGIAGFKYTP